MDSVRQQIMDQIILRMQGITVASGYRTDIGARVEDWPVRFDAGELPAIAVCDLMDEPDKAHINAGQTEHRLSVQLRVFHSTQTAPRTLRKFLADLNQAIKVDATWGERAVTTYPRREGFVIPNESFEIAATAMEIEIWFLTETFNSDE